MQFNFIASVSFRNDMSDSAVVTPKTLGQFVPTHCGPAGSCAEEDIPICTIVFQIMLRAIVAQL